MKIVKIIQLKIVIFTAMKNRCILHGRVFVMILKKSFTHLSFGYNCLNLDSLQFMLIIYSVHKETQ